VRRLRIPAFIVVIVLAIAACSGGASPTTPAAAQSTAASAPASGGASGSNAVEIKGLAFNPASISVKTGSKITWTNNDSATHTVTLDDNSVDSGNVNVGSTFDHAFATAGTFAYHCKIHSSMHGTVVITP
jgi:plastocyanin